MHRRKIVQCWYGVVACVFSVCVLMGCAAAAGRNVEQDAAEHETTHAVVRKTNDPVRIDGILDDPAWAEAHALPITVIHNRAGAELDEPLGYARLSWDRDNLYVAFEVHTADIRGAGLGRDEASVAPEHDVVEVFIDVNGDDEHFIELHVNPWNAFNDLFIIRPRAESPLRERVRYGIMFVPEWNMADYETAVQVRGEINNPDVENDGWSVEMRLPFASLMMPAGQPRPAAGDEWRLQLIIQDGTKERGERYIVWSPTYESWFHHSIETWGRVNFLE